MSIYHSILYSNLQKLLDTTRGSSDVYDYVIYYYPYQLSIGRSLRITFICSTCTVYCDNVLYYQLSYLYLVVYKHFNSIPSFIDKSNKRICSACYDKMSYRFGDWSINRDALKQHVSIKGETLSLL
jgi:hypothetical protein